MFRACVLENEQQNLACGYIHKYSCAGPYLAYWRLIKSEFNPPELYSKEISDFAFSFGLEIGWQGYNRDYLSQKIENYSYSDEENLQNKMSNGYYLGISLRNTFNPQFIEQDLLDIEQSEW
jgi:hypothetical protein